VGGAGALTHFSPTTCGAAKIGDGVDASDAHRAQHDEWVVAARQIHEAVVGLQKAAGDAHRNYSEAVDLNLAMPT